MEFHSFKQLGDAMIRQEVNTTPEIIAEARRLHTEGDRDGAKRKLKELRDIVAKLLEWDKRKDADEITDQVTDLLADLDERGFIYLMKDVVSEGRWFTFVNAPAGLEPDVSRMFADGRKEDLPSACQMVLPHVPRSSLVIDEITIEQGEIAQDDAPRMAALWPLSSHFFPGEAVTVEVYDPRAAGGAGRIELKRIDGGDERRTAEVTLDSYGRGQHVFGRMESGEYRGTYSNEESGGETEQCAFRVGDALRASTHMRVQRAFVRADRLAVRLNVQSLGQPYRGKALVKISDRSTGKPVATLTSYVKKGTLDLDFSIRNDVGPFDLRLENANRTEHSHAVLPMTRQFSAELNQPGGRVKVSGLPPASMEGAVQWMGMFLTRADDVAKGGQGGQGGQGGGAGNRGGGRASWIKLAGVEGDEVKIEFLEEAGPVTIVATPAIGGEERIETIDKVEAGQVFSLPLESPYATLRVGAFVGDAIREASLMAFREARVHTGLDAPARAREGEVVKIKVTHESAAHSLLIVAPETRDVLDPTNELRNRLLEDILKREQGTGSVAAKPRVIRHGKVTSGSAGRGKDARGGKRGGGGGGAGRRVLAHIPPRKPMAPPSPTVPFHGQEPGRIFSTTIVGEGEFPQEVELPPTSMGWKLTLVTVSPQGFDVLERVISVRGRSDLVIDVPTFVGTGDRIDGGILYRTNQESPLHVLREGKRRSTMIKGSGREPLVVSRPTEIEAELYEADGKTVQVSQKAAVHLLDHEVAPLVEIRVLSEGEEYERAGARVVESLGDLLIQVAGSLDRYPFDHAEARATRLGATLVLRDLAARGAITADLGALESEIGRRWRQLAECQEDGGLFAPSSGSHGDPELTRQILRGTLRLRRLPAEDQERLAPGSTKVLDRSARALLDAGVQDARLTPHLADLKREPEAFEEMAAAYFFNPDDEAARAELLKIVTDPVAEVEVPRWGATVAYGGDDEASADALKVCLDAGKDRLFDRGFTALAAHLVDYRLRSPSATLAFLELLVHAQRKLGDSPEAGSFDVGGSEETPRIRCVRGRTLVISTADMPMARVPEIVEGAPKIDLRCQSSLERVRPGDVVTLTVLADPPPPSAYELTVLLPGVLALREGREPQIGRFVMTGPRLDIPVVAIRTGQGLLRSFVESVTDHSQVGVSVPHRVISELPPPPSGPRGPRRGSHRGGGPREGGPAPAGAGGGGESQNAAAPAKEG